MGGLRGESGRCGIPYCRGRSTNRRRFEAGGGFGDELEAVVGFVAAADDRDFLGLVGVGKEGRIYDEDVESCPAHSPLSVHTRLVLDTAHVPAILF